MITSKDNSIIKHIKAISQKKYRDEYKEYVVEGIKMCLEAVKYAQINKILICKELLGENHSLIIDSISNTVNKEQIEEVSSSVFKAISDTQTPQGIIAICKQPDITDISDDILFVLDDIQDPGNLGTIIRTLDSAGYKDLIVSSNTVDHFNTKVIRSTMGAIFRLNIIRLNEPLSTYLDKLKSMKYKIAVTALNDSVSLYDTDFSHKMAIIMGNESKGVDQSIINSADLKINIPMIGQTESLNVAVATSIIAYEKVRKQ